MIHSQESKSTDSHGLICETPKMSISDFGICDFTADEYGQYGSFSFKPTNSSEKIKCSKLVQTGFHNIKFHILYTPESYSIAGVHRLFSGLMSSATLLTGLYKSQNVNPVKFYND